MRYVDLNGKRYRVSPWCVEVYIPMGSPRVMRHTVKGHWRRIKEGSKTCDKVRRAAM